MVFKSEKLLKSLENVKLYEFSFYAKRNSNRINQALITGQLSYSQIESALEQAIYKQAKYDYQRMTQKKPDDPTVHLVRPDELYRTDCFAYALQKKRFTRIEKKRIPFDHGESIKSYVHTYGKKNLPTLLLEELLSANTYSNTNGSK